MSPIDKFFDYNDPRDVAEGSEIEYQFRLYSPHPTIQIVILSNDKLSSNRFVPHKIVHLANQAVRKFELNPSQVVWVEYTSPHCNNSASAGFNLIQFDWLDGKATSPHRSPIREEWYLSWLEGKFASDALDLNVRSLAPM
ncbi:MAG TPA: hypothetical protein V6C57_10670 [Coleofasciculaceae cyanobacterium]